MTERHEHAKRPVNVVLAGPYGHPWHPILVTVPIGAWVCALVFDIVSRFADDPGTFAVGARWLIAIGVLGALAAATVGILDLFTIPTGTAAFRTGIVHMALNLAVTAAYFANFAWRQFGGDPTGPVPVGPLALAAVSLAALALSGWLGGKLAYRYGVRVAAESVQAEGFTKPTREGTA